MKTKRTNENRANAIRKIRYSAHCKGRIERILANFDSDVDLPAINESDEGSRPRLDILIDEHSGKIIEFQVGEWE